MSGPDKCLRCGASFDAHGNLGDSYFLCDECAKALTTETRELLATSPPGFIRASLAGHITPVWGVHKGVPMVPGSALVDSLARVYAHADCIHVLQAGQALCGLGMPTDWPPGHRWTVAKQGAEKPTCPGCLEVVNATHSK